MYSINYIAKFKNKKCNACKKTISLTPVSIRAGVKSWEDRKYCSTKCWSSTIKGKPSKKRLPREEISCLLCKKVFTALPCQKRKYCSQTCMGYGNLKSYSKTLDEKNHNWKGDDIKYSRKHKWLVARFGHPKECCHCHRVGLKSGRCWNIQWANISGEYKRDVADYVGLCPKCHAAYDKQKRTCKKVAGCV